MKQLWWNSVVEQWNSLGERWNSDSGQCCGTVEQLWWNSVGGTGLVEQGWWNSETVIVDQCGGTLEQ